MQQGARLVGRLVSRRGAAQLKRSSCIRRWIHRSAGSVFQSHNAGNGIGGDSPHNFVPAGAPPVYEQESPEAAVSDSETQVGEGEAEEVSEVDEEVSEESENEGIGEAAAGGNNAEQYSFGEQFARAQAQEMLLLTEGLSDAEEEEEEEEGTTNNVSYLHKLTIHQVAKILRKLRAIDLKILNVQARCQWADYMVFATGKSTRHIRGMADRVVYAVKKRSTQDNHMLFPTVEGRECENWMVVDCGDIIVHVFNEDSRARYNLEWKWSGEGVVEMSYEETKKEEPPATPERAASSSGKKKKLTTKKKRLRAARDTAREVRRAAQAAREASSEPTPV